MPQPETNQLSFIWGIILVASKYSCGGCLRILEPILKEDLSVGTLTVGTYLVAMGLGTCYTTST